MTKRFIIKGFFMAYLIVQTQPSSASSPHESEQSLLTENIERKTTIEDVERKTARSDTVSSKSIPIIQRLDINDVRAATAFNALREAPPKANIKLCFGPLFPTERIINTLENIVALVEPKKINILVDTMWHDVRDDHLELLKNVALVTSFMFDKTKYPDTSCDNYCSKRFEKNPKWPPEKEETHWSHRFHEVRLKNITYHETYFITKSLISSSRLQIVDLVVTSDFEKSHEFDFLIASLIYARLEEIGLTILKASNEIDPWEDKLNILIQQMTEHTTLQRLYYGGKLIPGKNFAGKGWQPTPIQPL